MPSPYEIRNPDQLLSPSYVIFRPIVERNIDAMLRLAGSPDPASAPLQNAQDAGRRQADARSRHHAATRAATIAEVEMLANCGVTDAVLAYNPIGPNIARVVALKQKFPKLNLAVTADHLWGRSHNFNDAVVRGRE